MAADYEVDLNWLEWQADDSYGGVDPFEQTDFLVYESPRLRSSPSTPSTVRGFWAHPPADSDSEVGPACIAAPHLRRQLRRPRSAILPRGNGAAAVRAAAAEERKAAEPTVLQRRQELERDLKKDLRRNLRTTMQQEAASSRERAVDLVRRKKEEAQKIEAQQREIIARAVSRGSQRVPAVSNSTPAVSSTQGASPKSAGAERRFDSPSSASQKSAESRQKPKVLTFEQLKGVIEGAYDRPLLMHSYHKSKNHYEVLGLDASATVAVIRAKFNTLTEAEKRQEGGGDPAKLEAIAEAHAVLTDPQRRRDYDEALTGRPCPPRTPGAEKLNADLAERVGLRRQIALAQEKQFSQELQDIIAKGSAKAPLAGLHKLKPSEGVKSVKEYSEEKREELEIVSKIQRAKINDIKTRSASRERGFCMRPSSPQEEQFPPLRKCGSSERYEAVIAEIVAEKKLETQQADRAQRQNIKEACARAKTSVPRPTKAPEKERRPLEELIAERKALMDVETKAQWDHIRSIRARAASRERRPIHV